MITVYVLYSSGFERIYIGMTNDVERRLKEHNSGQNKSTKAYKPWVHIHREEFEDRISARKREKYLKSFRGRKFIKELLLPQYLAR